MLIHFKIRFLIHHNLILTLSNKNNGMFILNKLIKKYRLCRFIGPLQADLAWAVVSEANIIWYSFVWPAFSHYFDCGKRYRWERVQFGWSFHKNPTAYIWHRKSFSLPCICAVCSCHGALRWGEMWNDLYKLSVYNLETVKAYQESVAKLILISSFIKQD